MSAFTPIHSAQRITGEWFNITVDVERGGEGIVHNFRGLQKEGGLVIAREQLGEVVVQ
jgi:hypothetical protein